MSLSEGLLIREAGFSPVSEGSWQMPFLLKVKICVCKFLAGIPRGRGLPLSRGVAGLSIVRPPSQEFPVWAWPQPLVPSLGISWAWAWPRVLWACPTVLWAWSSLSTGWFISLRISPAVGVSRRAVGVASLPVFLLVIPLVCLGLGLHLSVYFFICLCLGLFASVCLFPPPPLYLLLFSLWCMFPSTFFAVTREETAKSHIPYSL